MSFLKRVEIITKLIFAVMLLGLLGSQLRAEALNGDADGDGSVTIFDFLILKSNYGTVSGATESQGDFDGNGAVNIFDFLLLKAHYGLTEPTADAGVDQQLTDSDGDGQETVTLDGSASFDSDGLISTYQWYENQMLIATGQSADVPLLVGSHLIELVVTDDDNISTSDIVSIQIASQQAGPVELLVNGDFESPYPGGTTQLGMDIIFPATVSVDPLSEWTSVCVGDWVRGAVGNWQSAPAGSGTDSALAAVTRKTAGTMQVIAKDSVIRGDTLTLNWDYRVQTGLIVGPTFSFRILGVNIAGDGEITTALNGISPNINSTTTFSGESYNYQQLHSVSLSVDAAEPTNGSWLSAAETSVLVEDDWDYIVLIFGRSAGDNNTSGNQIDNISLTRTPSSVPLNRAPEAAAGADISVLDSDGDGFEIVTLDGSASVDLDGVITSYSWQLDGQEIATGETVSVSFAAGSSEVTLVVTDDAGESDSDTVEITVEALPPANALYPGSNWDGTFLSGYSAQPVESAVQIGSGTAKAIARWDLVPNQIIDQDFEIGVIAFHHEGINRVEFLCEGNVFTATEITLNAKTGVNEYTAALDISQFDNGANGDGFVKLFARVIPNSGYERLLEINIYSNADGTLFGGDVGKVIYVDGANGDDSRTALAAQSADTPVKTLRTAVDLASTLATYNGYGGNGVILEILTPGFYPFNRPSSNYAASWLIVRPTEGLSRSDVVIGAAGNETEWPSLNLKAPIKFQNLTIDVSYWTSMSSHWADNCTYTDRYGVWHAGGSADWDAGNRTLTRQYWFMGYDHAARAAAGQNYMWIRDGSSGVVPGIYEIESKISDDAVVLAQSCSDVDASVTFGRGHDILRTNNSAYATSCDFLDMGSGPNAFKLVRNCYGDTMSGDFMKEWQLVINTEVKNFHGAWAMTMHSDIFQRVAATDNCIIYNVKATNVDEYTQLFFFENSATTIGGNGQHDNWAIVNSLFSATEHLDDPPYAQFCRTNEHCVMLNNTFLGEAVAFRGDSGDESFVGINGLFSQNIFDRLYFTDENLTQSVIEDNHFVTGSVPVGDSLATSGSSLAELFADPANNDFTPVSQIIIDRAVPVVPADIDGNIRLNPTAIGALEK